MPSLFEIILRVLNDVRSVLLFVNSWGAVQTNYLRMQSFARGEQDLFFLAQFDESARPTVGTLHLLRGIFEGFPHLYPFVSDVRCSEKISQLRIDDIVREFPDYDMAGEGDRLSVCRKGTRQPVVEAIRVPLKSERVRLSRESVVNMPETVVVTPTKDQIEVLTDLEDTGDRETGQAQWVYRILHPLENIRLQKEIEREHSFAGMTGRNEKMLHMFGLIRSISETDMTVLIQGETGTGKELIAKVIHYNSPRKTSRFLSVNCAALSETLLESELFGHEKGAFTGATTQRKGIFESADGGTLFLDEVGEISSSTQVRLLRVLQENEFHRVGGNESIKVNVRIVAATNQDLTALVQSGRFRQDLFYRLHVFPIAVPPLRERADDIPLLVSQVIEKRREGINRRIHDIDSQALAVFMAYSWPGNIRELENVVQRMMVVCKGEVLDVPDIPTEIRGGDNQALDKKKDLKGLSKESAGIIEQNAIRDALSQSGGNVTRAAKALGISRATLQSKMKTYGLRGPKS